MVTTSRRKLHFHPPRRQTSGYVRTSLSWTAFGHAGKFGAIRAIIKCDKYPKINAATAYRFGPEKPHTPDSSYMPLRIPWSPG